MLAALDLPVPLQPERVDGIDDASLVSRARDGDRWALDAIYRKHVQAVGAVSLRLLRHREDMEDVVQETFVRAFERLEQLEDPRALRAWLMRIAVSRSFQRMRWRKLKLLFGNGEEEEVGLADCAQLPCSAEVRVELSMLDAAVEKLPRPLKAAWVLRHVVGVTLEEAALTLGCSLATVKRRVSEADARVDRHVSGPPGKLAGRR